MFNPNGFQDRGWSFPIENPDDADRVIPAVKAKIRISDDDGSRRGNKIGKHVYIGCIGWIETSD